MSATTVSSREFNQDTGRAKKAALHGPVFITDRGKPAHVLLSMKAYEALTGSRMTLADAVAQADPGDFDFDPPRVSGLFRAADLD